MFLIYFIREGYSLAAGLELFVRQCTRHVVLVWRAGRFARLCLWLVGGFEKERQGTRQQGARAPGLELARSQFDIFTRGSR